MRLIGTVIPFIGFREVDLDDGLRGFLDLGPEHKTVNTFQLEWLGLCVILPIKPDDD